MGVSNRDQDDEELLIYDQEHFTKMPTNLSI
jgi:hypothetical protein